MIDKPHPSFSNDDTGSRSQATHSTSKHDSGAVVRPPSECYIPIEADSARRRQIENDPTINSEHLGTLADLILLRTSDEEKTRVFLSSLDKESSDILDDLLEVAITEMQAEHATVVGLVNVMILRMLDICVALERQELGLLLYHHRSPDEVRVAKNDPAHEGKR